MGCHVENDGRQTETPYGQRHAPVLRGRHSRRSFHDNEPLREGQPQIHEELQPGEGDLLHPVPGRQQPLRLGDESAAPGWKFHVDVAGRDQNVHEIPRMDQIVHLGGRPRVHKGATRPSQRLPASSREGDREQHVETHSQARKQEKVRATLQKPTAVPEVRDEADQNPPWYQIHREQVLGKIHCQQHGVPEDGQERV